MCHGLQRFRQYTNADEAQGANLSVCKTHMAVTVQITFMICSSKRLVQNTGLEHVRSELSVRSTKCVTFIRAYRCRMEQKIFVSIYILKKRLRN